MKNLVLPSILFCIALSGCAGVKFAEAPVNAVMPESFTKRSIYPSAIAVYEFQELAGTILSVESGKDPLRVGILRSLNQAPTALPITESLNYYHSRIQQGVSGGGQYLAFAANLSADAMVDFELDDISRASTDYTDEVITKLTEWVKKHPKPNSNTSRLWVKSVVLTRQKLTNFVKIDANASGQVGEVTGVKVGVYRKDENSNRSTILGFDAFDIDQLVAQAEAAPADIKTSNSLLEITRSVQKLQGQLRFEK
ncbi:MAG: hypothetical protein M0R47_12490 [Methylobacter sp.]|jgi:hypothetical protein|uniref:hypothetical protein n=1 Tax=Methylobacter sp. TaxID=2051955 RepID=UPI002600AB1F|nr:hypothetical protein [Methylobacter sp.]MCK9621342.1 hypothetical protein [Methylobacter sp.]